MLKNTSIQAYLDDYNIITFYISNYFYNGQSNWFKLKLADNSLVDLEIVNKCSHEQFFKYTLSLGQQLKIGDEYTIIEEHGNHCILEYRYIVNTLRFETEFYSSRNDFGCVVSNNSSKFVLWAPTANNVILELCNLDNNISYYPMNRVENGCFEYLIDYNCHGFSYNYLVFVNGQINRVIDPYSYGLSINSNKSVVVDYNLLNSKIDKNYQINRFERAIICEVNVRDFSISTTSNSNYPGKFLGLIDSVGKQYLLDLEISHVQLMPVNDFWTVDDINNKLLYNWGYDPYHYFGLEGSYSSNINDNFSRINDFIDVINYFHRHNILVNLDVVFNHVYDSNISYLNKIVPYYYFRYNQDGLNSNGSFCGNDIESRRLMVRKFIVDCIIHYIEHYNIDGFRFDLMGILDIDTMNEIYFRAKALKDYILIYGEGWDMPTMMDNSQKAIIANNSLMNGIGFFNDFYRDNVKGPSSKENNFIAGYCLGDINYFDNFVSSLLSNISRKHLPKIYDCSSQSINYVECHDNMTLWDKINIVCWSESLEYKKRRQMLCLAALAFSQGHIFFQFGQEHCRSKHGYDNTYNMSDEINQIDYEYFKKFEDVNIFLKKCLDIRNKYIQFFTLSCDQIENFISVDGHNGAMKMRIAINDEALILVFNPNNYNVVMNINHNCHKIFGSECFFDNIDDFWNIGPISCGVWYEKIS